MEDVLTFDSDAFPGTDNSLSCDDNNPLGTCGHDPSSSNDSDPSSNDSPDDNDPLGSDDDNDPPGSDDDNDPPGSDGDHPPGNDSHEREDDDLPALDQLDEDSDDLLSDE